MGDRVEILPGVFDQVSYHTLAMRILEGHGFTFASDWWPLTRAGEPTAHWSYLYTLYITALYALLGVHPLAPRLLQALLAGLLMPWLIYRLAQKVFPIEDFPGATPAHAIYKFLPLLSAAWIALYGYLIYYAGALMTETFYILCILWSLDCALRIAQNARTQAGVPVLRWLELGLALGFAVLLRQLFLLVVPFIFLSLWLDSAAALTAPDPMIRKLIHALPATMRGLLASSLVMSFLILPITIHNYQKFHRFLLLNTNAGFAFFWGNHPVYGTHFYAILPPEMGTYQQLIPTELRGLDEASLDRALMQRGFQFILQDPVRYLRLSISRIPIYFMFWSSPDSNALSNLVRILSFGLALPFMLLGCCLWLWQLRQR